MKSYILLMGSSTSTNTWNEIFEGSFDTLAEALIKKGRLLAMKDWCEVVDRDTEAIVYSECWNDYQRDLDNEV